MTRSAKTILVTALFGLVASTANAAPQPLITYFKPMPIVGKLSTTVWGASAVGARDPANGLEDNGASGGVGPQKETYFYWDGKIVRGNDGKYHLYASHWLYTNGFGPPNGGSTGWQKSIPMQAVSDDPMGPYVSQGDTYANNQAGNNMGHNVTALVAPTGTTPYVLSVGEIVPGQMFNSSSANGPWTLMGLTKTNANGHSSCGDLSSNFTFTIGPDNRFWATSRGGCVMDSDSVLGTYNVETNSVLPNLENNDNGDAEDECIWYSGGYFHIVYNYWNHQRAYHIMSKNGTTNWVSTGLAYQGTQSPTNSNSKWLRYTDGTVNTWHNMERLGVLVENGHPTHFTFAVTDTDKNTTAVNQGGSKILVVPFDGVRFDCDNGDQASCAELNGPDGGTTGGAGSGGAGAAGRGGPGGAAGSSGPGGTTGTAGRFGGTGGAPASGGSVGTGGVAAGGSVGTGGGAATGGTPGTGGIAATGGRSGSSTGGATGTGGTTPSDSSGGCSCSTASGVPLAGAMFVPLLSVLLVRRRRRATRA
ncbi:MAG: MYXO-CTERM sorting domain-containing protein [Polyangia bacterium]